MLSSDISLDDQLYRDLRIPYDELTLREQQCFEEQKDVLHDEIYGKISRFRDTRQSFVSADAAELEKFRDGLVEIWDGLMAARAQPRQGRRVREYLPKERCDVG